MLMMGRRYGVEFPGSADEGGGPDEAVSLVDDGTATVVCVWETKVSQKSGDWRVAVSFFTFTWVCTSPMSKEGMCEHLALGPLQPSGWTRAVYSDAGKKKL